MLDALFRSKQDLTAKINGATPVIKVVELVGVSPLGFEDAIRTAVERAARTLRHITGVDVRHLTVSVSDGHLSEYRVDLKIAFALDDEDDE